MLAKLLLALGLMAVCVAIHAAGLTAAVRWLHRSTANARTFWRCTGQLIAVAGCTIVLHLVEIAAWAMLYVWTQSMPDLDSAFYFSAVTYTTTGYGDLVLPSEWRLVGGVEAITGILMCGLSTAFFFTVVTRLHHSQANHEPA